MVTLLLELIEGPPTRAWIVGQTPGQALLDVLQLACRAALLTGCSGCW
jgi:hypothetical protein